MEPFKLNEKLRGKRPLIIAGPCSAESQEQLLTTARELAESGAVDAIRAGVWKPRSLPNTFEGVGEEGLEWLAEIKQEFELPVAVEVATPQHVEAALKHDIDILWIGARTTVSPFAVQEIADALKGVKDRAILLKNPVNPDLSLWSGAVERLLSADIDEHNFGLIHRGFSYFGHTKYRNAPMWHIAFEMRDRYPNLPILCDPSHISGSRDYLLEVSQTAAELCYDGLIIESHIEPECALSDAAQQITPNGLIKLLEQVKWRESSADNPEYLERLATLRQEIDQLDAELFELLSRRMRVSEQIGGVKHQNNVAILQGERWRTIVERILSQATELDLSEKFIKAILQAIHIESIEHQNRVINR